MLDFELLGIFLGFLQGLFEWLPVSSEGQIVIVLAQTYEVNLTDATSLAFFAHIGTSLVVFLYYRHEFFIMIQTFILWLQSYLNETGKIEIDPKHLKLLKIVIITTIFTLPTAIFSQIVLEEIVLSLNEKFKLSEIITLVVGIFLVITGIILYSRTIIDSNFEGLKFEDIHYSQAIILGLIQGFTALPGISRSGTTVTYLLIGSKLDQNESLRASFIVGAPVTLGAGFLQILRGKISFAPSGIINENGILIMNFLGIMLMIISAFIIGALTLKAFLELAKKVRFDYFLIVFGAIAILAVLFGFIL